MKKIIALLLCLMMVLPLVSCEKNEDPNAPSQNENTDPTPSDSVEGDSTNDNPATQISEAEKAMEMYEAALRNEIAVFETDSRVFNYLMNCKRPYDRIPLSDLVSLRYAYTDLDGDTVPELVIDCGDTLILRYYEGTVYVYPFTFRNMYQLNTDGSYPWNHTGLNFEYGESQIFFEDAKICSRKLWRIVNDGTDAEYYIDGKQVTQEEILKYIEDNPKTRIEFSPLEVSWLNKISRAAAVSLAQEYWASFYTEDKGNIIVPGDNSLAPSHVYVVLMRRFVSDHWSTIDEIWIDKNTGEAIIPYVPDGKG